MHPIVLTTINASYIHASLGLRYLFANMGSLKSSTRLVEFTLNNRPEDIVESLVSTDVSIVGFGVYIWNSSLTTETIRLLKIVRPDITVIVGGPEVSFETGEQEITRLADHIITGQADTAFAELCQQLIDGEKPGRIVSPLPIDLAALASPYACYTNEDLANRVLYVEASRGCPFKCEFCLSSLDKTAVPFHLDAFLGDMESLVQRGARHFKFVDRTFNLKADTSRRILEFFLTHVDKGLFLHFELIPDRLPDALRELLPRFPAGTLQFEIGIQSFNPGVQQLISRKQQHERTCDNLRWLRQHTHAHIHADLIVGLPGEDLASFGRGFDQLYALGPQEIQVGVLKRLRGTPITRHTSTYDMRYMSSPPYRILANRDMDFGTMQRMVRFARYWDLIGNSGRFPNSLPELLGNDPFQRFLHLSDWLFATTTQTHRIALPKLFTLLCQAMTDILDIDESVALTTLSTDYKHNRLKGLPAFLRNRTATDAKASDSSAARASDDSGSSKSPMLRQQRHVAGLQKDALL